MTHPRFPARSLTVAAFVLALGGCKSLADLDIASLDFTDPAPAASQAPAADNPAPATERAAPETDGTAPQEGGAVASQPVWHADPANDLETQLRAWGERAGWDVRWDGAVAYPLKAAARFEGDFVEAASSLLGLYQVADPPVRAWFFSGNRVLFVAVLEPPHA